MFGTMISIVDKYDYFNEKFQLAYEFLRRTDLAELPVGSIQLGLGVIAHIQQHTTTPAKELRFETHDQYFDVQYIISGTEKIGMINRAGLELDGDYDKVKDITFYREPEHCGSFMLDSYDFVVIEPEVAHKPRCSNGVPCIVKKIVVKVPV